MYAIFRAAGKQFRAEKGKTLRLPLMSAEAGSKVTFDEVLLSSDGETIKAGTPLVKGAKVMAEVVGDGKEPKIYVFKFKRRASAVVYRGPYHRPEAGLRAIWHIKRA
jgi:large subunit ribosomal protein L21